MTVAAAGADVDCDRRFRGARQAAEQQSHVRRVE
jgi:hypothetical protein